MRNITSKFYRTVLFTVCNQLSVSLNLIIITDNINIIILLLNSLINILAVHNGV